MLYNDIRNCSVISDFRFPLISSAPELKLVLPARKEYVKDQAFIALQLAAEQAIYQHIATLPEHTLSYKHYTRALALDVDIAPAARRLRTYFPPTARYGRPGFVDVLKSVHGTFLRQPDTVAKNVGALKEALGKLSSSRAGGMPSLDDLDKVARSLARNVDPFFGGFGAAPKFPNVPGFLMLWRAWLNSGNTPVRFWM